MHSFWVLVTRSHVEGQWTSHCLNLDIVSQGNSIEHAFDMAKEAVILCMRDDIDAGLDPLDRPSAPMECWVPFFEIIRNPIAFGSLKPEQQSSVQAVAGQLHVGVHLFELDKPTSFDEPELAPPAWQIAAFRTTGSSQPAPC